MIILLSINIVIQLVNRKFNEVLMFDQSSHVETEFILKSHHRVHHQRFITSLNNLCMLTFNIDVLTQRWCASTCHSSTPSTLASNPPRPRASTPTPALQTSRDRPLPPRWRTFPHAGVQAQPTPALQTSSRRPNQVRLPIHLPRWRAFLHAGGQPSAVSPRWRAGVDGPLTAGVDLTAHERGGMHASVGPLLRPCTCSPTSHPRLHRWRAGVDGLLHAGVGPSAR